MDLFAPTISRMIFLFAFIIIGYIVTKTGQLPSSSANILSKMENMIFIPALVLGTFIKNFTVDKISSTWKILLFSLALEIIIIVITLFVVKLCARDKYTQKIYTYGLCFSNFGFMGNAVVSTIFPEIFTEYIIFTLPLWSLIYIWGAPTLLIGDDGKKQTWKSRLKPFLNPMFIAMIIGMLIGLSGLKVPDTITSVITVAGDCMSPIAMLLTGITLAGINLSGTLKKKSIYAVSILRLLIYPLVFIGLFAIIPCNETLVICTICSLAMPLGLNTIVIPSAYGKDTSVAAGMALVSHLASVVTIPLIFTLLRSIL